MSKKNTDFVTVYIYPYNVHIYHTVNPIKCGQMTWGMADKYMTKLNHAIAKTDCGLHDLQCVLQGARYKILSYQPWRESQYLSDCSKAPELHIGIGPCPRCDKYKCLDNIISGQCTNDFVTEYIGKVFWPKLYNKAKTR